MPTRQTYRATVTGPLFFSSREGQVVETSEVIAATALMHALGYNYAGLTKHFLEQGESNRRPNYERLTELPFFVSDAEPISVEKGEVTIRTTKNTARWSIISKDGATVGKMNTDADSEFPPAEDTRYDSWRKTRNYVGINPGSTFEFTTWTADGEDPFPERLSFKTGIKRTGQIRAEEIDIPNQDPSINKHLIESAYDVDTDVIVDIARAATRTKTPNNRQSHRYIGVDMSVVEETLLPHIL